MSGIAPLGPGFIPKADSYQYRSNGTADTANWGSNRFDRDSDSVELSPTAQRLALLDRALNDPPMRQELIDQVRQQIESGRYDTNGKIDRVVDEIWNDHFADDTSA